jgi:hypothetical protein
MITMCGVEFEKADHGGQNEFTQFVNCPSNAPQQRRMRRADGGDILHILVA